MMSRLWTGLGALALVCALTVPASAQLPPAICNLFPGLPGCPPPPPDLEARVAALEAAVADLTDDVDGIQIQVVALALQGTNQQSQIDALLMAVNDLNTTVAQNEMDIATLQMCCDDLQMRVSRLEAVVDCQDTVCPDMNGMQFCVDTLTDDNNCGGCGIGGEGSVCAANEECVDGTCELLQCDPINQCNMAVLMMDGTCVQTPLPNDTVCDDGMFCTVSDICQFGVCVGFGTPCNDPMQVCDEGSDMCIFPAP